MKRHLLITHIFLLFCTLLAAQENPFVEMAGKPYREYYAELRQRVYLNIDTTEPQEAASIATQMREAARQTGKQKWAMEAGFYERIHAYRHTLWLARDHNLHEIEAPEGEKLIPDLQHQLQQAERLPEKDLAIRVCNEILSVYFNHIHNYELGFRYCLQLDALLSRVSAVDFPLKPSYYISIEHQYNRFGEYDECKKYCYKALENPEVAYKASHSLEQGLNELGNIYRNHDHDLRRSDSCYQCILDIRIPDTCDVAVRAGWESEHALWSYIAQGQLGTNHYLRGEYDQAIPLLAYAVEKIPAHNPYNYSFTASKALTLVSIYTGQNNLSMAKRYLDSAYVYITRAPENYLWPTYYPVAAHYYSASGNTKLAIAFMDSTLQARNRFEEDFNLRKLYLAKQQAQQEALEAEQLRSENYQRTVLILSVFTAIVIALLMLLSYFYRQKRKAYRSLVRRIQQWAETATAHSPLFLPGITPADEEATEPIDAEYTLIDAGYTPMDEDEESQPDEKPAAEADRILFERIHHLIVTEQLYRNPNVSQEDIAQQLNVHRVYISYAVNRQAGKNFSTYLNEFRVKEAVRIMSEETGKLSLEGIAYESGFNDRKTFYTAFKKITGLSPSQFRDNLQEK